MHGLPRWTVCYNITSPENRTWLGSGWEFFDSESDADISYKRHLHLGNCPTKRPYYHKTDFDHLGVIHQENYLRNLDPY